MLSVGVGVGPSFGLQQSVFSPSDISGLVFNFDASDSSDMLDNSLASVTSGEDVREWQDSTGNYTAIQTTTSAQPTYEDSVQNGLGGVAADSDDFMLISNDATLAALDNEITVVLVYSASPTASFRLLHQKREGTEPAGHQLQNDGTPGKMFLRIDTSAGAYTTSSGERSATALDGSTHVISYRLNSGNINLALDGTEISNTTYSHGNGFGNTTDWRIVSNFDGYYHQMLCYDNELSNADYDDLINHLKSKWGIS